MSTHEDKAPTFPQAHISSVMAETVIDAAPERVWRAMIDDIGTWWPQDFYNGGEPGRRRQVLEEEVGGRLYESWEGGGGLLWGTVSTLDPGALLQLSGQVFPAFGGPKHWFGTLTLTAEGEGTRLRIEEAAIGPADEDYLAATQKGWDYLFCRCLKAHIEGSEAPSWE